MAPTFNSDKRTSFDSIYQYSRQDHLGCRSYATKQGVSCQLRSMPLYFPFCFDSNSIFTWPDSTSGTSSVNPGELSSKEQHLRRVIPPDREQAMFLANKWDKRSNAFSCDRYGVSAPDVTMSIFAEILSICATRVPFACAILLRAVAEIPSFSQSWRVTAGRPLFAT